MPKPKIGKSGKYETPTRKINGHTYKQFYRGQSKQLAKKNKEYLKERRNSVRVFKNKGYYEVFYRFG